MRAILAGLTLVGRIGGPLAAFVLLSWSFDVGAIGELFYMFTIANLAGALVEWGHQNGLPRQLALVAKEETAPVIAAALWIKLQHALYVLPPLAVGGYLVLGLDRLPILLALFGSVVAFSVFQALLIDQRLSGRWAAESGLSLISGAIFAATVSIPPLFLPVGLPELAWLFLLGRTIPIILVWMMNMQRFIEVWRLPDKVCIQKSRHLTGYFFANNVIGLLFLNVDLIVLKEVLDSFNYGLYQASVRIYITMTMGTVVVNMLLIPHFPLLMRGAHKELLHSFKRKWAYVSFIAAAGAVGIALVGPVCIPFILGGDTALISEFAPVFAIVVFLRYFAAVPNALLLAAPSGHGKVAPLLIATPVLAVACFVLGDRYGIYGAIGGLLIASTLHSGLNIYWSWRHLQSMVSQR